MPDETPKPKPKPNAVPQVQRGNVKLIGIAGLVKGEQFSIEQGKSVIVGRSRECNISLREVPKAKAIAGKGGDLEQHFSTVSRKHVRITYIAPDKIELEDLSSNGTFLDGERVEGKAVITDVVEKPHELKLGTSETFQLDWWQLVPRSQVEMVKVKAKKPAGAEESSEDADSKDKDAKGGKDDKAGKKPADKKTPDKK